MLSLRLCGQLIRTFPIVFRACQARFNQAFVFNMKKRGYVVPIVYLQSKRTYYEKDLNNNRTVRTNNNNYKRNNNFQFNNLRIHIELLKIQLKDMKVDYEDLLEAINIFDRLNENVDDSIGIFLLQCCGEVLPDVDLEIRQALSYRLWKLLEKKNKLLSHDYYHAYLNVCAQNVENIDPKKFIELMKVKPNKDTYLSLLNVAVSTGDLNGALFLMSKIKELQYTLNIEVVDAFIKLYSTRNCMKSAQAMLNNAIETGITLPDQIYGSLVCGYAQQGDVDEVISLLNKYKLSSNQLLKVLRNLSLANEGKYIPSIFHHISADKIASNPYLINIIVELTYLNKIDDCLLIIDFLSSNRLPSDMLNTSKHFLQTLARGQASTSTILNASKKFYEKYEFTTVILALLRGALISNKTDLSFLLLEKMSENNVMIRPHYYWPLFIHTFKEKGESGIFNVIDHLIKMGAEPDNTTLFYYIIPYISTLDPIGTFRKLTNRGLQAHIVITPLIRYYLENGHVRKAQVLCKKVSNLVNFDELLPSFIKTYEMRRDDIFIVIQMLSLSDKKRDYFGKFLLKILNSKLFYKKIEVFKELLDVYKKNNITISSFSAIAIEDHAFNTNMEKIATLLRHSNIINDDGKLPVANAERISGIIHPKYMNENQLACHLIELQAKGLNFRGLLRKIFMVYCKNNNLQKVQIIKTELDKYNIQLTAGMKSNLLSLYAENNNGFDAYYLILDLRKNYPDWNIDPPKILKTAIALVKKNEIEKAVKIIEETKEVAYYETRNCWKLLETLAYSSDLKLVEQMLNLLVRKGFCEIGNRVLGPLIRVHLLKNDLPSAVRAFIATAKKFHKTPLRQELISILVGVEKDKSYPNSNSFQHSDNNNVSMLDEVIDFSLGIHGRHVVDFDLMIAYARNDMTVPLKKILEKLPPDPLQFKNAIKGMKDHMKQKVLMVIFETARGINTIDRHMVCDLLLSSYSNTGNIQNAQNLWQKMKDEGIVSTSLRMDFSKLLDVHKPILNYSKKTS